MIHEGSTIAAADLRKAARSPMIGVHRTRRTPAPRRAVGPAPKAPSGLRANLRMWRTRSVRLNVRLPDDVSVLAEELQQSDPDFMNWIVQYGLTRRSIYDQMRDADRESTGPSPALT